MTDPGMPPDPFGHIEPWDRQPGEGAVPYRQFQAYRDMGPTRTVRKVAETVQRSAQFLQRVAYANRWVERAQLWDAQQDRDFRAQVVQRRKDMVDAHVAIARSMLSKVVARLREIDPAKLSPRDLVYWVDVAVKVERLALGESADGNAPRVADPAEMSEEEILVRLQAIRDEADARLRAAAVGPDGD